MGMMQMSVVTDSPVHSSSSDDFAAFLDAELGASSPDSSPVEEAGNQDELESVKSRPVRGQAFLTQGGVSGLELFSSLALPLMFWSVVSVFLFNSIHCVNIPCYHSDRSGISDFEEGKLLRLSLIFV
ncbi:hypothetical protein VNO80_22126 [Phaseolus coccineus]|uniref:Uncharacterized protein n=1 Tax=Phaseolus coccineus TaxID=3886 RepID=A0AAN9M533_PHACN